MNFQAGIPFRRGFEFVHEYRLFRMTDCIVKVYILLEIAIHVAHERQKGCQTDAAGDPDLLGAASFIIEHAIRTFDDRVRALFQLGKQLPREVPAGFNREPQYVLHGCAGDREWMGFVQILISGEAYEQELSGTVFLDWFLLGAQGDFSA